MVDPGYLLNGIPLPWLTIGQAFDSYSLIIYMCLPFILFYFFISSGYLHLSYPKKYPGFIARV